MKIEDNFLDQDIFDQLQNLLLGTTFAWYYAPIIDYVEDTDRFQFIHIFYKENFSNSQHLEQLYPIIEMINPMSLWRIKANLLTKTPDIVINQFHIDNGHLSEEKLKQWTTSIFYVNTNNGYTKFEDGTKVESVANRLVTFPSNLKHTGTTCSDEKIRVIINFNYFEKSRNL